MLTEGRRRIRVSPPSTVTRSVPRERATSVSWRLELRSCLKLALLLGLMVVVPLVWTYWITKNMIVLSVLHVCHSLIVCAILTPLIWYDCDRMLRCRGRETDNISTAICVISSLFLMSSYVIGIVWGASIAQSARIICGIIDFVPCVALPAMWVLSRVMEHRTRVLRARLVASSDSTVDVSSGSIPPALMIVHDRDQVEDSSYQVSRVPTFIVAGSAQDVWGVMDTRERPQVFDEVDSVFNREGISSPQQFPLGV